MKPSDQPVPTFEEIYQEEYGKSLAQEENHPTPVKEKKDNEIFTSFAETEDIILEQIMSTTHATHATLPPEDKDPYHNRIATHAVSSYIPVNKKNKYIIYTASNDSYKEVEQFALNEKIYRPISSSLLDKGSVKLPSGVEEYGKTSDLVQEIKEYLFSYFEPPKFYENFLPFYVLFTWVYEKFPFIAYLHFTGLTGTGKTIAAETISNICYKPVDAAGSVTIASIFRLADQWKGTLFLDEFDLSSFGKEGYRAVLTFLKTGVSDRAVLRVEGEKKKEVQSFIVKSPKIFTSENPVTDAGLQSRTFLIQMEKNRKQLPLYKLDKYYKKSEQLRNKLLLWRLRNLKKINLDEMEFGFDPLKPFDGRVQQIITPIYYLSDKDTRETIVEFAKHQEEETFRERRESLEGKVFDFIVLKYPVEITLSMVHEHINKGKTNYLITERKLGNIIRKKLNFDIERKGHENISTLIIDKDRLDTLKEYYGHRGGSVASDASDAQPQKVRHVEQQYIEEAEQQIPF